MGLDVDPSNEEVRWGSIYWAKIKSIDAALDAVFLDLDGENTGILYNGDVRWLDEDGKMRKGGAEAIGKRFKAGDFVPVQAKSAYLSKSDDAYAALESKAPQMSMDITLPGRYLVFGGMIGENRISQRIRDKAMRTQLQSMLDALEDINGCILRAAAANTQTDVLRREGKILKGAWEDIQEYFKDDEPALIALGPDAIQRTLSDQAAQPIERIEIVTMDHFQEVEDWCTIFAPDLVTKIQPVELDNAAEDMALFYYRDIIGQIEDLFQPYVLLENGGNIIIQSTAALTAVDVNKGGAKGSHLAVNIEAAQELARQIRLRNCGGTIVVDFLKMRSPADETRLIRALEEAFNSDPCTVQIHGLTKLGLLELTRKRRTPPLKERFDGTLS
ncbi:MAG: ribonuclease E/G [Alphaproteobacteria bacterium]|nr:ribonuclease E/G [Alphaproteobacteria bacterium]